MSKFTRIPISYQDSSERIYNFDEVCLGYTKEEAMQEAKRCIQCKNPTCVPLCPVSIDIPSFIYEIANENFKEAAQILADYSALPAVCGRVCPQEDQCEKTCILGKKGEPIAIGKLERFAADWAIENGLKLGRTKESNGHKVAVIGSGPAGITCAGELAKEGYKVKMFEALHEPGGVLVYGIPEFRLPKEKVVKVELNNLKELGVDIETNVIVGRTITVDDIFDEGYEAIFIGSGAGLPIFMTIPGENTNGVYSANEFLTRNNLMKAYREETDTPIKVGKRVAVVGGGNVAMDAARTAKRLGAEVHVIYRRTKDELPARVEEVENAMEEGIIFNFLTNPVEVLGDEKGWVKGIKCIKMELGEPDESGRRRPIPIEGSESDFDVDTVIMALGTSPNPLIPRTTDGLEADHRNRIKTLDDYGKTTRKAIFAGGDNVTGSATVILAMGAGKEAAKAIDEYIKEKSLQTNE
ncbi:MAG: NADPH-dependent glutamate synthase [Tissierellaceae bacterium]|nr:NADPH-dependent glutamate synthase [Tissierellaceae bacterium]